MLTDASLAAIPLPYILATATLTALGAWMFLARRRAARQSGPCRPPSRTPDSVYSKSDPDNGPPSALSKYRPPLPVPAGDRRSIMRREGLTAVVLTGQDGRSPQRAYVVNRTSGGLRLAVKQTVPLGTILKLRACNAPANTPWADVLVVCCEVADGHIEVGCQFQGRIPWSVLLLFG